MKNKGFWPERLEHNPREKAFAEQWAKENEGKHIIAIDYGCGTLQGLFVKCDRPGQSRHHQQFSPRIVEKITKRDRLIVATVIQWLGSNVGMCFLHTALAKCGYRITKIDA